VNAEHCGGEHELERDGWEPRLLGTNKLFNASQTRSISFGHCCVSQWFTVPCARGVAGWFSPKLLILASSCTPSGRARARPKFVPLMCLRALVLLAQWPGLRHCALPCLVWNHRTHR